MPGEFFVTVDGPRGEEWERVLGTRRLPVLAPVPVLVDLHDAGRGVEPCYLMDVRALSPAQRDGLVDLLAERFGYPREEVWEEVLTKGVPILAEGCAVEVRRRMVL
jgi:hypothetical protein